MPSSVHLLSGTTPEDLWSGACLPWFRQAAAQAWTQPRPTVVLTPSRQHGFYLKSLLLRENIAVAGIHFWTPGECRDALVTLLKHRPIAGVREHLHLLLAAAAEQETTPLGKSVARDPSGLMRALDTLSAGGWDWKELPHPSLHPVIERFRLSLDALGWTTVQHIDRLLAKNKGKAFARLLVVGFDGAHWPFWNLLQAAVAASDEATVCLTAPRTKADRIDQAWIGSWEQVHGEAEGVPGESEPGPFAALADRMENPDSGDGAASRAIVRLGYDLQEQARAAAAQAMAYLGDPGEPRIGILLPGYGALSREMAAELTRHGVTFNDTIGFNAPASPDDAAWHSWLALQAAPELPTLLDMVRTAPDSAPLPFSELLDAVTRAAGETLTHDLAVLASYLRGAHHETERAVGAWLAGLVLLPERATLAEFLKATRSALAPFAWTERADAIDRHAGALPGAIGNPIGRTTFLAWLERVTTAPFRLRNAANTHPFARIHLVTYAQAEAQQWSHLILTGLNEGVWPQRQEPIPFLADAVIDTLNAGAIEQGRQGEGHETVKPGRAIMLGPTQRRALLQRQFYNLIASASRGLCLTASLTDEADPSRPLLPSEYLTYLYYMQDGDALSEPCTAHLQRETARWLQPLKPTRSTADVSDTRAAHRARRDASHPFGPFEFALASAPATTPRISCQRWEHVIRSPAIAWMELFCGVACLDLDPSDDGREMTRGSWIHRWLGHAIAPRAGTVQPWPDGAQLRARLETAANETRSRIAKAFADARHRLPDRWTAAWMDAQWTAQCLALELENVSGWPHVQSEMPLPDPLAFDTGAGLLRLAGRIDLLLTRGKDEAWIIDFKTGRAKPLTPKNLPGNLAAGRGIQLALYVLALRAMGAQEICASLVVPGQGAEPQITLADVATHAGVWRELCRMQDTGIFGMREELRPEFGRGAAFPLATLAIEQDILGAKWSLTHPVFSKEAEE